MRKNKDGKRVFYRWSWGSFYPQFSAFHIAFGPASYFDNRFFIHCHASQLLCLLALPVIGFDTYTWLLLIPFLFTWGELYLHIPFIKSQWDECEPPRYGVYYYAEKGHESIWFNLGINKNKCFYMPWALTWVRTSALRVDGTWEHEVFEKYPGADLYQKMRKSFWDKAKWGGIIWEKKYPYRYTLRSGEVQQRIATVRVEEREWRQRWLTWTNLFNKVSRSISIDFNHEVGEETGSWKGGCMGCGYSILPGESPEQCLRRMEKERKF